MSYNNDICDFCGEFVDPIGNDVAQAIPVNDIRGYLLWCAICYEGADYQWSELSVSQIQDRIARYKKLLKDNPFVQPAANLAEHFEKLHWNDNIYLMEQYLKDRMEIK